MSVLPFGSDWFAIVLGGRHSAVDLVNSGICWGLNLRELTGDVVGGAVDAAAAWAEALCVRLFGYGSMAAGAANEEAVRSRGHGAELAAEYTVRTADNLV